MNPTNISEVIKLSVTNATNAVAGRNNTYAVHILFRREPVIYTRFQIIYVFDYIKTLYIILKFLFYK